MVAIGRNDPCPCRSGRKYKRCCLIEERLEDGLRQRIQDHAYSLGEGAGAQTVMKTFVERLGLQAITDPDIPVINHLVVQDHRHEDGRTALEHFRDLHGATLSAREAPIVDRLLQSRWGLFQVLEVEPGVGVVLEDCLTGERLEMRDIGFSQSAERFILVYGRVFPSRGAWAGDGVAVPIPAGLKDRAIAALATLGARAGDPRSSEVLSRSALEAYARIRELVEADSVKRFITHERDPVLLCRVQARNLDGPRIAQRLDDHPEIHMDGSEMPDRVHFTWAVPAPPIMDPNGSAGEENVIVVGSHIFDPDDPNDRSLVLASITVTPTTLRIETLSEPRIVRAMRLVQELAPEVNFGTVFTETHEEAAARTKDRPSVPAVPKETENQAMAHMREQHKREWLDERIPALGGRTPREAARDPRTRIQVVDLLREYAYHAARGGGILSVSDIEEMAAAIGVELTAKEMSLASKVAG